MIKFIDLFAGIGGFHLAMKQFQSECVFASEWDGSCKEVYEKNFGIKPKGDITIVNEKYIPDHEILFAGFPCQAFSISGKQKGFNDTRGTLFFDVARIAKYKKPKVLFLENVGHFLKHNNGETFEVIRKTLNEIGYDVRHKILNASDYGVPQSRKRIYIIAFRKDLKINNFEFPISNNTSCNLEDILEKETYTDNFLITKYVPKYSKKIIQKDIFGNYPNKPIRIGHVNKAGQGERIYSTLGHAVSLTAHGGGVGAKTGLYKVENGYRRLTPRECARVSGFPDNFILHDSKIINYRQFGNTVVVTVVKEILQNLIPLVFNAKVYSFEKPKIAS